MRANRRNARLNRPRKIGNTLRMSPTSRYDGPAPHHAPTNTKSMLRRAP